MMGESIEDPHHVESNEDSVRGLGLLPVRTTLRQEKVTRRVAARTPKQHAFSAYEIHMGETVRPPEASPFAWVGERPEGICHGRCAGTYLHNALLNPDVLEDWIGFRPPAPISREACYDRLADWFERWVDNATFGKRFLSAAE